MKVIGLVILHYGREYLRSAIEAIYPVVDEIVIVYSDKPTHGHGTDLVCPDTFEELNAEAHKAQSDVDKITWINKNFDSEWKHRNFAFDKCKELGADVIVVADADEVWETEELKSLIEVAWKDGKARYRIMMQHFYRSFGEVCRDGHRQVRIMLPNATNNEEVDIHTTQPVIHHFGYAQSEAITKYKISCHGHKSEWRPEWLQDKFLDYKYQETKDCHPVCKEGFWTPEVYARRMLPEIMHTHPYFNLDIIK